MKYYRIMALIVFFSTFITSFAEDYVNYFRKGTEWIMQTTSIAPDGIPHTSMTTKSIKGDTVVDNRECLVLQDYIYDVVLHVDGDKIWWYNDKCPQMPKWHLLYDFGLNPGDRATVVSYIQEHNSFTPEFFEAWTFEEECVDLTPCKGNKGITLMLLCEYKKDFPEWPADADWLKGIGSTRGVLMNAAVDVDSDSGSVLVQVISNGEVVYQNPNFSEVEELSIPKSTDNRIYDIYGRPAECLQKGTIYISNGKKFTAP